ncbi:CTLH domain-containing protein [Plasmodiophora brassicae]|uniref:Uncharacterized protein n=1 Tax=Plasmodiophora brassicae TaxID=37360 RepID=A0A0G4IJF7_PLABS|nr:hypothetical protein PBRA_003976 [Plasmodiophora brassicae]SPQ96341.1 unnamed protein product [Plasmodiophora brassicae]
MASSSSFSSSLQTEREVVLATIAGLRNAGFVEAQHALERESRVAIDAHYMLGLVRQGDVDSLITADHYFTSIVSMRSVNALLLSFHLRLAIFLQYLNSGDRLNAELFFEQILLMTIRHYDKHFSANSASTTAALKALTGAERSEIEQTLTRHRQMLVELTTRTLARVAPVDISDNDEPNEDGNVPLLEIRVPKFKAARKTVSPTTSMDVEP